MKFFNGSGITLKKIVYSGFSVTPILILLLTGCTPAPSVVLRIDCGSYNDKGIELRVNGEFKGECPLELMVLPSQTTIEALRINLDASYDYGRDDQYLVADSIKKITLKINREYPEEYYWLKASDIGGMHAYLEKLPTGKRRTEIEVRLEQAYFDAATDLSGMYAYLEKLPTGKRRTEIEVRLEQAYFDAATDLSGMYAYLEKLPTGKRRTEIEVRLEQAYFDAATDLSGMYKYLKMLPTGKRTVDVKAKVNTIFKSFGFRDNFDGTVTELNSGLKWMRCSVGQSWTGSTCAGSATNFKWDDAMKLAKDGWRLPTIEELEALVFCSSGERLQSARPNGRYVIETSGKCQGDFVKPVINQTVFPKTPSDRFWTSAPYPRSRAGAWGVFFDDGVVYNYDGWNERGHVRLLASE